MEKGMTLFQSEGARCPSEADHHGAQCSPCNRGSEKELYRGAESRKAGESIGTEF